MGLFSLFWDLNQEQRIRQVQDASSRNVLDVQSTHQTLDELRAAIDRLALVNQALWEILRERTNMTDAELTAKVDEVDRRDGVADGRLGPATAACPQCRRPNAESRTRCLYCGATLRPARAVAP